MRVNAFAAREMERPVERPENVCGVLVMADPKQTQTVSEGLTALPGGEVHAVSEEGKMVVTVEDAGGTWAGATIEKFNQLPGVLSVALVYHHFDSCEQGEIVP